MGVFRQGEDSVDGEVEVGALPVGAADGDVMEFDVLVIVRFGDEFFGDEFAAGVGAVVVVDSVVEGVPVVALGAVLAGGARAVEPRGGL